MKQVTFGTIVIVGIIVAIFASGCSKQSGLMSPTGAAPSTQRSITATALRFEPFVDDNLTDRAAVALRPYADGVNVNAYNLGANGWAPPVASIQLAVRYDPNQLKFLGAMGHAGWSVDERSVPGEVRVRYTSNAGDTTGDADIGRLRFTVAEHAVAGDTILEMVRLWANDGCVAHAADGRYSQVNDYGGGIYYLTGAATE